MNRPTHSRFTLGALLLAAALFLPLIACDELFDDGAYFDSCSASEGDVQVAGAWTITGSGTVYDCRDEAYNGDVNLQTRALQVLQRSTAEGEILELSDPILIPGGEFNLRGSVDGSCVNFEAREVSSQGTITYRFIGYASLESSSDIVGSFTIEGPETCAGSGDFKVEVR